MIKAGELRIGNLINHLPSPRSSTGRGIEIVDTIRREDKSETYINAYDCFFENDCEEKYYEPIELSIEKAINWLGFKEHNGMYFLQVDVGLTLCYLPEKHILQLAIGNRALNYSNPKIHQVQNLFYTFSGRELEVKLPS